MSNTIFLTFAGGRTGWLKAAHRLSLEARKSELFAEVIVLTANDIRELDFDVFRVIQEFRSNGQFRGFGYWTWKPAILLWAQQKFTTAQILYMDAGSHLDTRENLKKDLKKLLIESYEMNGLAWSLPNHSENQWTKLELLKYLKTSEDRACAPQIQSGYICLPPSKKRQQFLFDYRSLAVHDSGFLFSDELRLGQKKEFVEHRHDQSALSLLWKDYELHSREDMTDPRNKGHFPIIAQRNNTRGHLLENENIRQIRRYLDLGVDQIYGRK